MMPSMLEVRELCQRLCAKTTPIGPMKSNPLAIDTSPQVASFYIDHDLTIKHWPDGARAIVVEAPAAVGKSELSKALASRLDWPLVYAERGYVGMYSIKGLLTDSLADSSKFISEIERAEAGLVIDALDEAQLKAGTNNFLAFLDDAASLVQATDLRPIDQTPSLVLLSRPDTAEAAIERFKELKIPLAVLEVNFLSFNKVGDFAIAYLRHRGAIRTRSESGEDYRTAVAHEAATRQLLKKRIAEISSSLQGIESSEIENEWSKVAPFLGYPPVLATLAESLALPNASAAPSLTPSGKADLLSQVLNSILDREADKFSRNAGKKLFSGLPAGVGNVSLDEFLSMLYGATEQMERLASWVSGQQGENELAARLPYGVQLEYERSVDEFLPNHPFLTDRSFANTVFRDFVKASLWRTPELFGAAIQEPGPFYARFLRASLAGGKGDLPIVSERFIDDLVASWRLERQLAGEQARVFLSASEERGLLDLAGGEAEEGIQFEIDDLGGVLSLKGPVRDMSLVVDALVLGTPGTPLQLGPNFLVIADEVDIQSESMSVVQSPKRPGAMVYAGTVTANSLRHVDASASRLQLGADVVPPRLHAYQIRNPFTSSHQSIPRSDFMDLRAILLAFESGAEEQHSCFADKMDRRIAGLKVGRKRILGALVSAKIVERRGKFYYIDHKRMREAGIELSEIRDGNAPPTTLDFLLEIRDKGEIG